MSRFSKVIGIVFVLMALHSNMVFAESPQIPETYEDLSPCESQDVQAKIIEGRQIDCIDSDGKPITIPAVDEKLVCSRTTFGSPHDRCSSDCFYTLCTQTNIINAVYTRCLNSTTPICAALCAYKPLFCGRCPLTRQLCDQFFYSSNHFAYGQWETCEDACPPM